jgi:hypothetical protein
MEGTRIRDLSNSTLKFIKITQISIDMATLLSLTLFFNLRKIRSSINKREWLPEELVTSFRREFLKELASQRTIRLTKLRSYRRRHLLFTSLLLNLFIKTGLILFRELSQPMISFAKMPFTG